MKMVKVKTAEATGLVLDWAVAMCEGGTDLAWDGITWGFTLNGELKVLAKGWAPSMSFLPSSDWAAGGPIMARIKGLLFKQWLECRPDTCCQAEIHNYEGDWIMFGPTTLVAVMRCRVASKLGEEIEVPAELVQTGGDTPLLGDETDDNPIIERPTA